MIGQARFLADKGEPVGSGVRATLAFARYSDASHRSTRNRLDRSKRK